MELTGSELYCSTFVESNLCKTPISKLHFHCDFVDIWTPHFLLSSPHFCLWTPHFGSKSQIPLRCYGDMWRTYCCLTSFFRLSIRALVVKIQPDKVARWCPHGDFFASFLRPVFQRAACNTFQTCILNSH